MFSPAFSYVTIPTDGRVAILLFNVISGGRFFTARFRRWFRFFHGQP